MEFLDIHDGHMVAMDKIVAIEAIDDFSSAVHVHYGNETRVFQKNIPYSTLRGILLNRNKQDSRQIDSAVSRSLEQLAKYQTIQVP